MSVFLFNYLYSQENKSLNKSISIIYSGGFGFPIVHEGIYFPINNSLGLDFKINNHTSIFARYKLGYEKFIVNKMYGSGSNGPFIPNILFSNTLSGMIRLYHGKNTAPSAPYSALGIGLQYNILNEYEDPYYPNQYDTKSYHHFDFLLHYGYGKNWLINKRFLLGFEIESSLPVLSFLSVALPFIYKDDNWTISYINVANETLRISLNIGFIAFKK